MRRTTATLAVAALLVLAGCSAGGGPGTTTGPAGDTTGDGTTGEPLYDQPLDASAVADAHLQSLRGAGSYTVESNATLERSSRNSTTDSRTVVRGDLESGAVYTRTGANQRSTERFAFANGTAYQRFDTGSDVQYRNVTGRVRPASEYARVTVETFVGLFDFSYAGTTTVDGRTVHVYEAAGASAVNSSAPTWGSLNESDIDAASATLHVREDGVVTRLGYDVTVTVDGTQQRVVTTQRFTAVGTTTVEPPAWIPEARQNTSG